MPEFMALSRAIKENRLPDFVIQAEAEGIGPVDRAQFDKMVERVTAPLPVDQTSRLPAGDCLPET
jgi:hypothetical protein